MFFTKQIRLWPRRNKRTTFFSIVLCLKKTRHRGAIIERLGYFHPRLKNRQFFLNSYRLAFWLNKGATLHSSIFVLLSHRASFDKRL